MSHVRNTFTRSQRATSDKAYALYIELSKSNPSQLLLVSLKTFQFRTALLTLQSIPSQTDTLSSNSYFYRRPTSLHVPLLGYQKRYPSFHAPVALICCFAFAVMAIFSAGQGGACRWASLETPCTYGMEWMWSGIVVEKPKRGWETWS